MRGDIRIPVLVLNYPINRPRKTTVAIFEISKLKKIRAYGPGEATTQI